jgi:hypothetical protein
VNHNVRTHRSEYRIRYSEAFGGKYVGQAGSLRGGWLPPPSRVSAGGTLWVRPIANRPQINNLPHNSTTLPFGPALKGRATIPE